MRLLILMVSFRKVSFIAISPDFLSCQFFNFDHNPPLNYVDCGSVILLQVWVMGRGFIALEFWL